MEEIIEVENFLPKMYEDKICETICDSENFNWNYLRSISHKGGKETFPSFFHMVFNEREKIMNECFQFLYPLICHIPDATGIQVNSILRMRLGLILKQSDVSVQHPPHIDFPKEDHYTALYYLNESDGDTFVYDQCEGEKIKNFTVKKKISPKKGKFAVFDGKHFHSSSSPSKNNKRIVLTVNFK